MSEIELVRAEIASLEEQEHVRATVEGLRKLHELNLTLDRLNLGLPVATKVGTASSAGGSFVSISIGEQQLTVHSDRGAGTSYPISTSKYGQGDVPGSHCTPLGQMEIVSKIGDGQPSGMELDNRMPTGYIFGPNSTDQDLVVTRILWLRGLEDGNRNAFSRSIYIHGTPLEEELGRPASSGCIRMRSADIIDVFSKVRVGTKVVVCQ